MRMAFSTTMLVLLLALGSCYAQVPPSDNKASNPAISRIEEMKARAERKSSADRARAYADIARELVELANQQFTAGEVENAQNSIKDAVTYSEKSAAAAQEKGKKIKDTEITLRETARRIEEVRRTLAVDDQPPLVTAAARIEELRRQLLEHMFKK
jgi:hypothetical protein